MKSKAICYLSQLQDQELFKEISEGLSLIIDHVLNIEEDARFLVERNKLCGYNILNSLLKEESAKFLILLDAIRSPRVPPNNFVKQLKKFQNHLAKGIYSKIYEYPPLPHNFSKVQKIAKSECKEYYLDGPNDVDWIFRNEILQKREEMIYVDYIENDGERSWISPKRYYDPCISIITKSYLRPKILGVIDALWKTGCTKPESLAIVAEKWRPISMSSDTSCQDLKKLNSQTLQFLKKENLLEKQPQAVYSTIVDNWLFPLHSLDIGIINVDESALKDRREQILFRNDEEPI